MFVRNAALFRKVLYFVIKNIIIYKNFIFLFIILTIFLIVKFLKLYLFNQLLKDIIPYPPYFSDNSKKYRLKMYSYSAMRFRFAQLTLLSAANKAQSSLQANRPMSDNVKNFVKYNTLRISYMLLELPGNIVALALKANDIAAYW